MNNVLCQKEEQNSINELFEKISALLQDSDDNDEKERIKKVIRSLGDTISYVVMGDSGVGKTSLLRGVFQGIYDFPTEKESDICIYRYGEEEYETVLPNGAHKRFIPHQEINGISIVDIKGKCFVGCKTDSRVEELIEKGSVIFVVFDVMKINVPPIWDMIERYPEKKFLFFVSKCDMVKENDIVSGFDKLQRYMKEAGTEGPIFSLNTCTLGEVRQFIKNNLLGANPIIDRQQNNIINAHNMVEQLIDSFQKRKSQYLSDARILNQINASLDSYVINHKKNISLLINSLESDINKYIDAYQNEIISKLDPYKIKERFHAKEDFIYYMNMVIDNYKTMMNESVNEKTMAVVRAYMDDLETIFREAIGYFNKRENILSLEDRFYGTLAVNRKQLVIDTRRVAEESEQYYKSLGEASEELFMQIWKAKDKQESKKNVRKSMALTSGGIAGMGAGAVAVKAAKIGAVAKIATMAEATSVAKAATLGVGLCGGTLGMAILLVSTIIGAATINSMAKTLFDSSSDTSMEKVTQQNIEQFKEEVRRNREQMINDISTNVRDIFEKEMCSVDSCFTEFRKTIHIDERKIALLEDKIEEVRTLLCEIESTYEMRI